MSTQPQTPARPCPAPPPRHKRALLTFAGLLGPVYLIPPALAARLPEHPVAVVALAVASIVILMTWVIMPALQHLFASWLRA